MLDYTRLLCRVAPDPIFSIPPDPDRISEVESGRSRIRIPGVVDNETLIIKKTQNINLKCKSNSISLRLLAIKQIIE
jgi:hypothetical protein